MLHTAGPHTLVPNVIDIRQTAVLGLQAVMLWYRVKECSVPLTCRSNSSADVSSSLSSALANRDTKLEPYFQNIMGGNQTHRADRGHGTASSQIFIDPEILLPGLNRVQVCMLHWFSIW
jgi:hypothetical protein